MKDKVKLKLASQREEKLWSDTATSVVQKMSLYLVEKHGPRI
jgi:hypothetical protein